MMIMMMMTTTMMAIYVQWRSWNQLILPEIGAMLSAILVYQFFLFINLIIHTAEKIMKCSLSVCLLTRNIVDRSRKKFFYVDSVLEQENMWTFEHSNPWVRGPALIRANVGPSVCGHTIWTKWPGVAW